MTTKNPSLSDNLKKADLKYSSDTNAGITRKRENQSFKYFDTSCKHITNEIILNRINLLSIPPAWENVWICPSSNGYLQAVGFDDKGRKQYIYHQDWIKISQENKFHKMIFFASVLPQIRKKVSKDMAMEELEKNRIIATVIWLLEHTFIRIGNEEYAMENDSFGLTTLRNKHVKVKGKNVKFEFRGKSGVEHSIAVTNPKIAKIIKECIELPGYEIFKYLSGGEKHILDSADVNNYLKNITGEDITAKDFRTWGGTVICASSLYTLGFVEELPEEKKVISKAVKTVSKRLHNTAKVCRNYYIHPTIIKTYQENILIPHFQKSHKDYKENMGLTKNEFSTLTLLQKYS